MPALPILLVAVLPARASYPDDVSLTALASWNGEEQTNLKTLGEAYATVVQELGVAIANKMTGPAETLGTDGMDVSMTTSWTFIHGHSDDASKPAPWQRVHPNGDPSRVLWMPRLEARKGLPLSFEVGAQLGYVGLSREGTFGAWGRFAPFEGYKAAPDVAVQWGYAAYVGNDELKLSVWDLSAQVSKTFPFGVLKGVNQASIAPWFGVGLYRIHAVPMLDETEQEALGVSEVSGFKKADNFDPAYAPFVLSLGFRVVNGDFQVIESATLAPKVVPTITTGFGYVF